jgi:predicted transglutaminase-like cysteine proteinase
MLYRKPRHIQQKMCIAMLVVGISFILAPTVHASHHQSLFTDRYADIMGGASILPKWVRMVTRSTDERPQAVRCPLGSVALCQSEQWQAFERRAKGLERRALLEAVNDFVNRVAYRSDEDNYGAADYWASPREFFENGGDCEDYVISKYFILKHFGVAPTNMRMAVVVDDWLIHAILIVVVDENEFILDNRFSLTNSEASMVRYRVIYSFDEQFAWIHRNAVLKLNRPMPAASSSEVRSKLKPRRSAPSDLYDSDSYFGIFDR